MTGTARVPEASIEAPPSRNSPCPCGSGLRYKDCHGSLATPRSEQPRARSAYRAPGAEWLHLDPAARDDCGALMEAGLQHQTAGRIDEAARAYRAVLARAPDTHDALHMLGVIELGRQNLDEAERLIRVALALRPPYAAIEHNLLLVHDARIARIRAQPEELAERALPILAELALSGAQRSSGRRSAPTPSTAIHVIGRVAGNDDDAWLLRRIVEMLGAQRASVWTTDDDAPATVGGSRVLRIDRAMGALPRGGTHVYVGLDVDCGEWAELAAADRVVAVPTGAAPTACLDRLRAIAHDGARPVELLLPSRAMASRFGTGHFAVAPPIVCPSPVAGARDAPAYGEWTIEEAPPWPAGIAGQNRYAVAEAFDTAFVQSIAAAAGRVHVHDPGRMRYQFGADARVRFHAKHEDSLLPFLASLKCYVHRVSRWWHEGLAREMFCAMALGVPVLCPRQSAYAEYFDDGVDGLLYESSDEAVTRLVELRRAPAFASSVGRSARAKAARLFDPIAVAAAWRSVLLRDAVSAQWSARVTS